MTRWLTFAFIVIVALLVSTSDANAAVDRDCSDFTYHEDAQDYFSSRGGSRFNDVDNLDSDHDGIACELLPHRPGRSTTGSTAKPTVSASVPRTTTASSGGGGGISGTWIVGGLAAGAVGIGYYFTELHGPDNQRAPRTPGAKYDTRTMPYPEYLKTPEWAAIRTMVLERDGNKCTECGSTSSLQAHHKTYARRGHEKRKDLTTLCRPCHEKHHRATRRR